MAIREPIDLTEAETVVSLGAWYGCIGECEIGGATGTKRWAVPLPEPALWWIWVGCPRRDR